MLALEREALNAFVGAIRDSKDGLGTSRVYHDAVRTEQLTGFLAGSTEGSDVVSVRVVLIDVA